MKQKSPYSINLLRGRMAERGYHSNDLTMCTGRTVQYINQNILNPGRFRLEEVYAICEELEIPLDEIPKYFPPSCVQTVEK